MLAGAFVTSAVQLDFATRTRQDLVPFVPKLFRSFSQNYMVLAAANSENAGEALKVAKELVRRRPMPAESLSLYAVIAGMHQNLTLSSKALTLAAERGWRDPLAQRATLISAVASKNWTAAAQRLDALERTGQSGPEEQQQLAKIAGNEQGRAALANRLVSRRNWMNRFLGQGASALNPTDFSDIVRRVVSQNPEIDCATLSRAATTLAARGLVDEPNAIWSGKCVSGSSAVAPALAFTLEDASSVPGPFDWRYPRQPGIVRTFHENGKGWSIEYRNDVRLLRILAQRYYHFQPGPQKIKFSYLSRRPSGSQRLQVSIICVGTDKRRLAHGGGIDSDIVGFTVPANCPVQRITLMVGFTGNRSAALIIAD